MDHTRNPCGWSLRRYQGIVDPLVLESLACREALQLAASKNFKQVIFEGDSKMVISALRGGLVPLEISNMLQDVINLTQALQEVSFSFIRRQCNVAALSLASKALRDESFFVNPLTQCSFLISEMLV
ncbi:uncharacterized protein LOC131178411 [Hevea brasiliensis]|uniref:uncharacterized protein LOC131178411 n=1 Tax=Hevea brasiliensis TaxID=3981 RepID=UPI0025ED1989|nr:uncharacterized protein LOC131178411 [Hevea brasiliensis]